MEDALRYHTSVDLKNKNTSQTLLVLLTGRNKRVLEVGPATGYVTRALKSRGCHVTAVEIDPAAAEIAAKAADRMIVGDIETLNFAEALGDEKFDAVIFGDVLEHLLDPQAVLERTRDILAPGGYVVASVPNIAHASVRLALLRGDFSYTEVGLLDRTHLRFYTRDTLAELFRGAGYSIRVWRRTIHPAFGTELGLRREDFPPYLVESLEGDPEAETYQFVVRAHPRPAGSPNGAVRPAGKRPPAGAATLQTLWSVDQRTQELERTLAQRDRLLAEQQETIRLREQELEKKEQQLAEKELHLQHAIHQTQVLTHHLQLIQGSLGYRILERVRSVIRFLAPSGSPQRLLLSLVRRSLRVLFREGPLGLLRRAVDVRSWPDVYRRLSQRTPLHLDLNGQYQLWLQKHAISGRRARKMRRQAARLKYRPLISILVPVYNPDPGWLRDTIDSVRGQLYENWELCLADDGSTREGVRELLHRYAELDPRIKVKLLEQNQGISGASNAALALATGDFVGLLDHDDELKQDALFRVVRLLNEDPDLDYIYSDEDKRDPDDRLIDPFFKPGWSPQLLYCLNYVTHFSVYRKSVVDEIGGFRRGFEGSQDYDLTLRVAERTDRIAHIAWPLYSWRMVPGSAASSPEAKNFAYEAAKRAIQEALHRRGAPGRVEDGKRKGYYRVRYQLRARPKIAIIIPTRDKLDMLKRCIDSIHERSTYDNYEIIIINNQSEEPETLDYLKKFRGRVIDYPFPFNYSRQMNLGVEGAGCEYVLLLNNDTEVISPGWMEAMLEHAQRPEVAAVGARLFYPGGRVQHEGVFIGCGRGLAGHIDHGGYFALGDCVRELSAVTAACMLTKASLYKELGGLDEELSVAYNDVDYCLKARARGMTVIYTPYAELYHHEGGTRGRRHPRKNEEAFRKRWWKRGFRDPYYNPNFDLDHPFNLDV
jgi:glycosyltransferase involved in cell wall biosynthesis/2-polyprenyl-3-methyl-5-hydroxy-6-metoxy-1,4-benzoquinol methylase